MLPVTKPQIRRQVLATQTKLAYHRAHGSLLEVFGDGFWIRLQVRRR